MDLEASLRLVENKDWVILLLTLCLMLLAFVRYFYPRRFVDFLQVPLNQKYFNLYSRTDGIEHPFSISFFFIQIISFGVLAQLLIKNFSPQSAENPWLLLQLCSYFAILVLSKAIIEKLVGNIFSIDELIEDYLFQKLTYRNLITFILFTGNLIFLFILPDSSVLLIIFALFILLLNLLVLFSIYRRNQNLIFANFLYFILYLCALEISPFVILYKIVLKDLII